MTEALINRGVKRERLVLIEYSRDFARLLRERFQGVTVVQGDAYAIRETLAGVLSETSKAPCAFVSSLPLLTRPEPERRQLLLDAFAMGAPDAPFIQFTYGGKPPVPAEQLAGPRSNAAAQSCGTCRRRECLFTAKGEAVSRSRLRSRWRRS